MESRLLFSRPRRMRWPRKNPSFVKVMTKSVEPMKLQQENILRVPTTQFTIDLTVAQVIEFLCINIANYTAHECLGSWLSLLLYTPYDFAATIVKNACRLIIDLPPLFTMVLVPLATCYLLRCAVICALSEYQAFLDLGRGGTPSTPMGLVRVSIKKFFARVDVLEPPHVDPMLEPYRGRLFNMKRRAGERPTVKGVAPQRQFDQKTPVETFYRLMQMMRDMANRDDKLKIATSYLEGHTDALKAAFTDQLYRVWGTDGEWDYEICHPHRHDGSLHVVLHPEDIKTIIERGWGERHPLATDSWWWKLFFHNIRGKRRPVPYNLVIIYAPRNASEYRVVQDILEAAVWFHKEKDLCDKINRGLFARTDNGKIIAREEALSSQKWVIGPDGRLMTVERALDRGLYQWTSCGTGVVPTFKAGSTAMSAFKRNE